MFKHLLRLCIAVLIATPAMATTPRDILLDAAFHARDKSVALAQIGRAEAQADALLARAPDDHEAALMQAMATAYRAKLRHSRSDALAARKMFDALLARDPKNAELQAAVGAWHIDAVTELGGFLAGAVLGAKRSTGLAAIDRAVALGGNRAMFAGLAALLRLSLDAEDEKARVLAETASHAPTPSEMDRQMRRSALAILVPLRAGDTEAAQKLARQSLPFGQIQR